MIDPNRTRQYLTSSRLAVTGLAALTLQTFVACSSAISVEAVEHGQRLDRAQQIPAQQFFALRMENRVRKINVGNFEILHENAEFVYLGKPRLASLFSNDREVETLYCVNRSALQKYFPAYKTIDGTVVRSKLVDCLITQARNKPASRPGDLGLRHWKALLADGRILADFELASSQRTVRGKLVLDPATLVCTEITLEK